MQEDWKQVHVNTSISEFIPTLFLITKTVQTTQISISWGVHMQSMVYPYTRILVNHKNESSTG